MASLRAAATSSAWVKDGRQLRRSLTTSRELATRTSSSASTPRGGVIRPCSWAFLGRLVPGPLCRERAAFHGDGSRTTCSGPARSGTDPPVHEQLPGRPLSIAWFVRGRTARCHRPRRRSPPRLYELLHADACRSLQGLGWFGLTSFGRTAPPSTSPF